MRVTGTFASDERTRGGGRPNVINLHVPDAAADADIIAKFQEFEALMNAKLVSVKREIANFGYNDLPEGLPGNLVKVLLKNNVTGAIEQVSWVFGKPNTTEDQLKALFTVGAGDLALQNRYGQDLGDFLRQDQSPLSLE